MSDKPILYTTKVTVEVEIAHQFDPTTAIRMVKHCLSFSAVKAIKLVKMESNYRLLEEPSDELIEISIEKEGGIPLTII
jgi:hypothetical protein